LHNPSDSDANRRFFLHLPRKRSRSSLARFNMAPWQVEVTVLAILTQQNAFPVKHDAASDHFDSCWL
jgi:hypothetical protein